MLEERFIAFDAGSDNRLPLRKADIIKDKDDPIGIDIAVKSLVQDLKDVTGYKRSIVEFRTDGSTAAATQSLGVVIIVAIVDSALAKSIEGAG